MFKKVSAFFILILLVSLPTLLLAESSTPTFIDLGEQGIEFGLGNIEYRAVPEERYPGEHSTEGYRTRVKYGVQPSRPGQRHYQQVNILTIDTRDHDTCSKLSDQLRSSGSISRSEAEDLCEQDQEKPLVSIMVVNDRTTVGINYSDMSQRGQGLTRQSRNFLVPAAGMMMLLWALPSSFTGWEKFDAGALGDKYVENVTTPPEIEDNKWWINWIGHPYAGAAYYVVARHEGFSRGESFLYSAFMSTFYWEYGVEALSEVPSIQDLIITPVFGALLGEMFILGEQRIRANGGKFLGSRAMGNVALNLMDPAGAVLNAADRLFPENRIKDARFSLGVQNQSSDESFGFQEEESLTFTLGIDLFF